MVCIEAKQKEIIKYICQPLLACVTWRKWLKHVHEVKFGIGRRFKSRIFPSFFCFFVFFCSSFYYIFVYKKNLFVNLNRQTMLARSAGSTLASTFFLYLTTRHGRIFFFNWLKRSSANCCSGSSSSSVWNDHQFCDRFAEWHENAHTCHADKFFYIHKSSLQMDH